MNPRSLRPVSLLALSLFSLSAVMMVSARDACAAKAKGKADAKPGEVAPALPPPDSSPMADLKKANANLKKILQKQHPSWSPETDVRSTEVKKVVGEFLDFEEVAKRALARHWEPLTPKQRAEFVATLRELVERNYLKQVYGQPDYDLQLTTETKTDAKVPPAEASVKGVVHATTKGKKVNLPLEYKVVYKAGHWVVYDVITDEDFSMLENYRAEFNKIITKDNFETLMTRMKKKLSEKHD